jgi:molybdenum cofactor cytidylyltransferase
VDRADEHRGVADALRDGAEIVATQFDGKRGHPVGFSRKYGALLAALGGDEGARSIVAARQWALRLVDVDDPACCATSTGPPTSA